MEQMWTELFYQETDAGKRQALLAQNSEKDNEAAALFREKLWIARYGKRSPKKDVFVGCLMELKYLSEGVCYRSWRQKKEGRQHRSSIRCVCPASVNSRKNAGKFCLSELKKCFFLSFMEDQ